MTSPTPPDAPSNPGTPAEHDDEPAGQAQLEARVLGYVFVFVSIVLVALLAYVVLFIVVPMSGTSPVFDDILKQYRESIASDVGGDKGVDKLSIDLIIVLEYASADIRTAGVQITFALVSGVFFASVGVLLFAAGITGALKVSGSHTAAKFNLATASPGIVCMLLGAGIIVAGITKDVSRPLDASIRRGIDVNYGQQTVKPPIAGQGEPPPERPIDERPSTSDAHESEPRP